MFSEAYMLAELKAEQPLKPGALRMKVPRFDELAKTWLAVHFDGAVRNVVRKIVDKHLDVAVLAERERVAADRADVDKRRAGLQEREDAIQRQAANAVQLMTEDEFRRLRQFAGKTVPGESAEDADMRMKVQQTLNRVAKQADSYRKINSRNKDDRASIRAKGWAAPEPVKPTPATPAAGDAS
jgi:hypothetical protein